MQQIKPKKSNSKQSAEDLNSIDWEVNNVFKYIFN